MAFCRRSPAVFLLLSLLVTDASHAYVIKRSASQDDSLSQALRVIQRAKRKLLDQSAYSPSVDYVWPDPVDQQRAKEYLENIFGGAGLMSYEDGENDYNFEIDESPTNDEAWSTGGVSEVTSIQNADEGEGNQDENTLPVGEKELEGIFDEQKNADNDTTTGEKSDSNDIDGESRATLDDQDSVGGLKEDDMVKLLNTVKETEEKVVSSADDSVPRSESVVKQVVINGAPAGDGKEHMTMEKEEWIVTPDKTIHHKDADEKDVPAGDVDSVNKEWLMEIERPVGVNVKSKRSGSADDTSVVRRPQLESIKEFMELEDEENSNLANALNLATMSQVERTDEYIPMEVNYLRKAIANEEEIQNFKDQLRINLDSESADDFLNNNEEEDAEPVNDTDFAEPDDDSEADERQAIDDLNGTEEDFDSERADEISELLSSKLRTFIDKSSLSDLQSNDIETNGHNGEWYDVPVRETSEEALNTPYSINPFLRELIASYRKAAVDMSGAVKEIDTEGDFGPILDVDNENNQLEEDILDPNRELCPAVVEYTDNCKQVRRLGVALDAEANQLCNRHQLCNACGAYYGLTREACDRGFLLEADRLCHGDETCRNEAASLYVLMQTTHRFRPLLADGFSCANSCALSFITGEY